MAATREVRPPALPPLTFSRAQRVPMTFYRSRLRCPHSTSRYPSVPALPPHAIGPMAGFMRAQDPGDAEPELLERTHLAGDDDLTGQGPRAGVAWRATNSARTMPAAGTRYITIERQGFRPALTSRSTNNRSATLCSAHNNSSLDEFFRPNAQPTPRHRTSCSTEQEFATPSIARAATTT